MRVGLISDIHGNLPALNAVLNDFQDVDKLVCLGDIVGVLGWNSECVERIRENCEITVVGNHDRRVFPTTDFKPTREYEEVEHRLVTTQLDESQIEWLTTLPEDVYLDDLEMRLVHSHPDPDVRWVGDDRVHPRYFTKMGSYTHGGVLALGHTHEQHAADLRPFPGQEGIVINPGSVGVPYYKTAKYATIDTETYEWELQTVDYDETEVIQRMKNLDIYTQLKRIHNSNRPVDGKTWGR